MLFSPSSFQYDNIPTRLTKQDFDKVLMHCVNHDASDVTLQTGEPIVAEVFGKLYAISQRNLLGNEVADLLNEIYGPNGMTQLSSGVDIDSNYEVKIERGQRVRFRVNGTACLVKGNDALQITMRTIPVDPPHIDSLDLEDDILKSYAPEQGCVVITGSTGSGKSTLLAALVRSLAEQEDSNRKILTYEAPIEFVYDNINSPACVISQSEIPKHLPSFAAGVRNALRRKPRLILVGEARDEQTIAAVIDAALTGHPVYTTVHSNGVADCVRRMISNFPADERHGRALDILEIMRLCVWQKLVPTVDGRRVALREHLIFDEKIRDQLIGTPVEQVTAKTRLLLKEYGQPIHVDAQKKYEAGIISERTFRLIGQLAQAQEV